MKKNTIFILSILMLSIFSFALVSAQDEVGTSDAGFNFLNWINHNVGTFSVVGNARQCGANGQPNQEIAIPYNSPFPSANTFCTNSITDIFDGKWNALGEYRDFMSLSNCNDADGCIMQVYCCPHPECSSNSDCISWYGNGAQCLTANANDANIVYKNGATFKYCSAPTQQSITCYYYPGTGSTCLSYTYAQSACPLTYMSHNLFPSSSQCLASIQGNGGNTNTTNPNCKDEQSVFYSNAEIILDKSRRLIVFVHWSGTEQVPPTSLDKYIPSFSTKYVDDKSEACCAGLVPVYEDEKTVSLDKGSSIFPLYNWQTSAEGTYTVYTCQTKGSGFCVPAVQNIMSKYIPGGDCQGNTILFFVGVIVLLIILGMFFKK